MTTYTEFAAQEGLTLTATRMDKPPAEAGETDADRAWASSAAWWQAVIHGHGEEVSVVQGMGPAHGDEEPALPEVLQSLADLARAVDLADGFEEWAEETGANPDSRRAERMYRQHREITEALHRVCYSSSAFDALLYATDAE